MTDLICWIPCWAFCFVSCIIQFQEWTETNEGSSLLDTLYKALDEVSIFSMKWMHSLEKAIFMYNFWICTYAGCWISRMRNLRLPTWFWCRSVSWKRSCVSHLFGCSINLHMQETWCIIIHQICLKWHVYFQWCFLFCAIRWSFNFFFYNRKLKRVVSFHICCLRWSFN